MGIRPQIAALLAALIAVAGIADLVRAESPAEPAAAVENHRLGSFAVGVNSPVGWVQPEMRSIGASLYLGLSEHSAVRSNFAHYENPVSLRSLWQASSFGETFEPAGTFTDAGLAWVWYPRRLWRGPTFELGALWRHRDTISRAGFPDETRTDSNMYGGRALAGWSWLVTRHVFVAIAVGGSLGYESGRATLPEMATARRVSRAQLDGEGYFRIGFAYGR